MLTDARAHDTILVPDGEPARKDEPPMKFTEIRRRGPAAAEDWEWDRDEHLVPSLEDDENIVDYRIIGIEPHAHGRACPSYGDAALGDWECSAALDVDIVYEVTVTYDD